MLSSVLRKSIFDYRRSLIGWGLGTAAAAGLVVSLFPVIRDTPEIIDLLESYPEVLLELFGIDNIDTYTSPPGFLETQLFGSYVPLIFLIFGIGKGIAAIAGEEQERTLDVLLANPITRERVVLEKAGATVAMIGALGVVLLLVMSVGAPFFDGWPGFYEMFSGALSAVLLGVTFAFLGLATGAVTGRRGVALGITAGLAVATFIFQGIAPLVDGLNWLDRLSPFFYYLDHDPLQNGIHWGHLGVLIGLCAVLFGVALWGFNRRDVGVA